jgi:hypothetical protein
MKYFLDTEFNEFGGALISLALVREDGESLYLVYPDLPEYGEWVKENVLPIVWSVPERANAHYLTSHRHGADLIAEFLRDDLDPIIITDWPDDIKHFCEAVIVGPGMMVGIDGLTFQMVRVDAYPTTLENAVQHNAGWDAMALRELLLAK